MPKKPLSSDNTKIPRLFELIDKTKISAKELSEATGIKEASISDWRSGRSAPTIEKLIVLADYFDVTIDFLVGRSNKTFGGVHQEITAGRDNYVNSTVNNGFSQDDIDILRLIQNIPLIERSRLIFELSQKYGDI